MWGGQADQHVGLEGRSVAEAGAWRRRRSWVSGRPGTDVREGHLVWSEEVGTCIRVQSQDGWLGGSPLASSNPAHPLSLGTYLHVTFRTLEQVRTVILPFHRYGNCGTEL